MAKKVSITLGVIFVIVGILGFFPNPITGMNSLFLTNHAHDIVHIISGLIFIIVGAAYTNAAGATLKVFGIIYLLIAILGFFAVDAATGQGNLFGFLLVNQADNWLHVVLAIIVFVAGVLASKGSSSMEAPSMPTNPTPSNPSAPQM